MRVSVKFHFGQRWKLYFKIKSAIQVIQNNNITEVPTTDVIYFIVKYSTQMIYFNEYLNTCVMTIGTN